MLKISLIIFLFLVCLTNSKCNENSNTNSSKVKSTIKASRYRIDIDKPIEPQLMKISPDFKESLKKYDEYFNTIPNINYYLYIARAITYFQPKEWHDEIKMLSRVTGLSIEKLIMSNISYEMQCTSLIVRNSNNNVFMGRNLDFDGTEYLARLSLEYEYYKDNKLQYIAATVFGSTYIANAIIPGKFTISLNQRKNNYLIFDLLRIFAGYSDPSYYLRKVMENAKTYEAALNMLKNGRIASSAYYIITGIKENEGAIITRDWNKPAYEDYLTSNDWFLVITNYDRNLPDSETDYRRVPTENKLKELGNNLTYQEVIDQIMSKDPTFANDTIFTTLQSASDGYFNTTVYFREDN